MFSGVVRGEGQPRGSNARLQLVWATLIVVAMAMALLPATADASFDIGLQDQSVGQIAPPTEQSAYQAMQSLGASTVRISVIWSQVAPGGSIEPSGFNPSNPADPHYNWTVVDAAVRAAADAHKQVLLNLFHAPQWAEGPNQPASPEILAGAWDPSPSQFAAFNRAAAERYSGTFPDPLHPGADLPRVKRWEIWNEENLPWYLAAPNLIGEYRSLLNAGYAAVKAVHPDNTVVMGGLAPVSFLPPRSVSPLTFAAQLMCLRRVRTKFVRTKGCSRASFDVFAIHPYSLAATPTKHAYRYDDVLVGDMSKVSTIVHTADRLHTIAPKIHHPIWVTEYGWYTNPPNNVVGDSAATAARYVAYSMYEMWRAGVSLVIWYTLKDYPPAHYTSALVTPGGGLETSTGRPKPMMSAFGFPFIAAVAKGRGYAWGRAPEARRVRVIVARLTHHRWARVATVHTAGDGVFTARFAAKGNGVYRASVIKGPLSLAYNSSPIPPKRTHLVNSG